MNLKFAITGPENSKKSQLNKMLREDVWLRTNLFSITENPVTKHLKNFDAKKDSPYILELATLNDIVKISFFDSGNRITIGSLVDVVAQSLAYANSGKITASQFSSIHAMCSRFSVMYTNVFYLENPEAPLYSKYTSSLELLPALTPIVIDSALPAPKIYSKIVKQIKEKHHDWFKNNEKDSNLWFSMFGKNDSSKDSAIAS